jgi:type III secretion protein I
MIDPANLMGVFVRSMPDGVPAISTTANTPDVARFQLALADVPGAGDNGIAVMSQDAASVVVGTRTASTQAEPAAPRTLGDAILQGLQSASSDITNAWRATGEVLNKPDITVSDMLRVQTMLLQSSVQYELVGKAVSKSTQSLENILKTQ